MRKFGLAVLTISILTFSSLALAQDHGEASVFVDYFRLSTANNLNMTGLGGRLSGNVRPNVALEVEGAYDFAKTTNITVTGVTNPVRTDFRATHLLVGPKIQSSPDKPWRVFGVIKGGFVRFGVTPGAVTFGTFPTVLKNTDLNGVFYPGAGVEGFAGWIGVRAEVGDEIFFDNGAHNNLKFTIGPVIRF
jgi:hypothetical protein